MPIALLRSWVRRSAPIIIPTVNDPDWQNRPLNTAYGSLIGMQVTILDKMYSKFTTSVSNTNAYEGLLRFDDLDTVPMPYNLIGIRINSINSNVGFFKDNKQSGYIWSKVSQSEASQFGLIGWKTNLLKNEASNVAFVAIGSKEAVSLPFLAKTIDTQAINLGLVGFTATLPKNNVPYHAVISTGFIVNSCYTFSKAQIGGIKATTNKSISQDSFADFPTLVSSLSKMDACEAVGFDLEPVNPILNIRAESAIVDLTGKNINNNSAVLVDTVWSPVQDTLRNTAYFDGGVLVGSSTTACGTSNFTIEFFMYPLSWKRPFGLFSALLCFISSGGTNTFTIFVDSNNKLLLWDTSGYRLFSTATVSLNSWQHICLMRANNSVYFFINGVPCGNILLSPLPNYNSSSVLLGGTNYSGSTLGYFHGYFSNYRQHSRDVYSTSGFVCPSRPFPVHTIYPFYDKQTCLLPLNAKYGFRNILPPTFSTSGSVTLNSFSKFSYGKCIYLQNSTFYTDTLNFSLRSNDFDLSLCYSAKSRNASIVANSTAISENTWFLLDRPDSHPFNFVFHANGKILASNKIISNNVWYTISIVRWGTELAMYIDGVRDATLTIDEDFVIDASTTSVIYIGSPTIDGYVDSIVLCDYARHKTHYSI